MNNRLYVGNLPLSVSEECLRTLFATKGIVTEVKLVLDPVTQQSRGSAFVTMATPQEAAAAMQAYHSYSLEKRNISVSEARPSVPVTGLIGEGFETGIGRFKSAPTPQGRGTSGGRRRSQGRSRGNGRR